MLLAPLERAAPSRIAQRVELAAGESSTARESKARVRRMPDSLAGRRGRFRAPAQCPIIEVRLDRRDAVQERERPTAGNPTRGGRRGVDVGFPGRPTFPQRSSRW